MVFSLSPMLTALPANVAKLATRPAGMPLQKAGEAALVLFIPGSTPQMTETECTKASETWLKVDVAVASALRSCRVHAQRPQSPYVQAC